MLTLSAAYRYYLYRGAADMRKGFDGLSGLVRNELDRDPLGGDVFIFFNRRRNQVKLLLWEGDGFSIYSKRLERGTYELPRKVEGGKPVSSGAIVDHHELMLILQGISLQTVVRRKRFSLKKAG